MFHKLQEGAIFIADSHYPSHNKEEFINLLNGIKNGSIKTPQLFLMGDIFDLLIGESKFLVEFYKKEIALLEEIAQNIEVIYLEGNHDFDLDSIFRNVKIIKITKQPFVVEHNGKTYGLSHGDKYNTNLIYKIYTALIRNKFILKVLPQKIAINNFNKMPHKKICKEIENFPAIVKNILKKYKTNYAVEGHFHQGLIIDNYISLPSFACAQKVAIYRKNAIDFVSLLHIL